MIITATLHSIGAFFFKWAMFFSHLRFESALVFFNPHVLIHHFQYGLLFKVARPYLAWSPIG